MKIPRMVRAITQINEDLIQSAAESSPQVRHTPWLKVGFAAACLAVLFLAGAILLPFLRGDNGKTAGRYRNVTIQAVEYAVAWPWEYQTVYEKYTKLTFGDAEYHNKGRIVSADLVGERIGTQSVAGYDNILSKIYTEDFEVYGLKYADQSRFVAVKMNGAYYPFQKEAYDPPNTLGELLAEIDLPKAIKLNHFSENGNRSEGKQFSLLRDGYVWEVLAGCQDAPFVEENTWTASGREYLSFVVTSETLGVYKVALYVTADGYLWTNAFEYSYLFRIGEEAAKKILTYARENAEKAVFEPYQNQITGKIIKITDTSLLLDDSLLCQNPADGITYQVLLNDRRISRYTERNLVKEGDTVQIVYEGDIGKGNVIDSAVSVSQAIISDHDVMIPE